MSEKLLDNIRLIERLKGDQTAEVCKGLRMDPVGQQQPIIICRVSKELSSEPGFAERFSHVASDASSHGHPMLARLLDIGLIDGCLCIILEGDGHDHLWETLKELVRTSTVRDSDWLVDPFSDAPGDADDDHLVVFEDGVDDGELPSLGHADVSSFEMYDGFEDIDEERTAVDGGIELLFSDEDDDRTLLDAPDDVLALLRSDPELTGVPHARAAMPADTNPPTAKGIFFPSGALPTGSVTDVFFANDVHEPKESLDSKPLTAEIFRSLIPTPERPPPTPPLARENQTGSVLLSVAPRTMSAAVQRARAQDATRTTSWPTVPVLVEPKERISRRRLALVFAICALLFLSALAGLAAWSLSGCVVLE